MLSSYLKQATGGSHRLSRSTRHVAASYSSGSEFSDDEASDYSSSILSFGSSAGSPASASEVSSWKKHTTFSSTQDEEAGDWFEDEEKRGTMSPSDNSSRSLQHQVLSNLTSPTFITNGDIDTKTHRRRPDRIDTLAGYDIDALCSGVPIDCRSADSQISLLDRVCDELQLDDLTSGQCVRKLTDASRIHSQRKRDRAILALERVSKRWESRNEKTKTDKNVILDEVEIVFDRSTEEDEKTGSLWDGLTLWEAKMPGSTPKRSKGKQEGKRVLGSHIVVSSPAPPLCRLTRKTPRVDASTVGNSTIPTEMSVDKQQTGEQINPRRVTSSRAHAFRSKLARRTASKEAKAPVACQLGEVPSMKEFVMDRSVVDDDEAAKNVGSPGLPMTKESAKRTILKNPIPVENADDQPQTSLVLSDDEDRKPGLNILLTRVPVHPETPSREGRDVATHSATSRGNASELRGDSTSRESSTAKYCLAHARKIFNYSTPKPDDSGVRHPATSPSHEDVEIIQEGLAFELRPSRPNSWGTEESSGKQVSAAEPCRSFMGTESSGSVTAMKADEAKAEIGVNEESVEVQPKPWFVPTSSILRPPLRDSGLYDSEGNKISPATLKRMALASEVRQASSKGVALKGNLIQETPPSSLMVGVRSKGVFVESKETSASEPNITSGRPSVKDLVKAIDEKADLSRKVEKKKVLRIFGVQKRQVSCGTPQKYNEQPARARRTASLTRSYGSDLGACATSELRPHEQPLEAMKQLPMRRTASLPAMLRRKISRTDSDQPETFDTDNSILASAEEPLSAPAQAGREEPRSTSTGVDAIEAGKTKVAMLPVDTEIEDKLEAPPMIEFSPIDFPIVSKQICSADQLAREFIIQGANQDIPVVLYPLLDFNPCDKTFTFPADVEDHTFGKKQTLMPPGASKRATGGDDNRQLSSHPQRSRAPSAVDSVSKNGSRDGGIEVALVESKRAVSTGPRARQLLGYVSHSGRSKRRDEKESSAMVHATISDSVVSGEADIEIGDELTESTHGTGEEQETSVLPDDLSCPESDLNESKTPLSAITNQEETPMTKVANVRATSNTSTTDGALCEPPLEITDSEMSNKAVPKSENRMDKCLNERETRMTRALSKSLTTSREETTADAVYEPSVEINNSELLGGALNPRKRVTFRNWHVPIKVSANAKAPPSQLKSILRSSCSPSLNSGLPAEQAPASGMMIPCHVHSEPAIEVPITGIPDTLPSNLDTPKTSNRITHPTVSFVDKIIGKKKPKRLIARQGHEVPRGSEVKEDRQPTSSTHSESSQSDAKSPMREVPPEIEGIELQAAAQIPEKGASEQLGRQAPKSLTEHVRALRKKRQPSREREPNSRRDEFFPPATKTDTLIERHSIPEIHLKHRRLRGTDTSTNMATTGEESRQDRAGAHRTEAGVQLQRSLMPTRGEKPEIPEKLPLSPTASDDDYKFLDDSPPTCAYRDTRNRRDEAKKGERSTSIERVSRWIGSMRPSHNNAKGLSKRDRERILKRHDKATRCFDDSAQRKNAPPIEKEVYDLLMEGNKTQEDIYQTLTEIAIARKRPSQSLAQAMNELERDVYQVYSEKCREKSEKKRAKRKEFDRKLMKAIRKKTEKVIREETEKARQQRENEEPSFFQEAIDFFSSFVICTEDAGLSPRRASPARRSAKSGRHGTSSEDVVSTPERDKRTFSA